MNNHHALERASKFLDSWLQYRWEGSDIPGFAIAVQVGDELVFSQAFGYANIKTQEPLTPNHQFMIGSQTKMFTATAILQLYENNQLDLDDSVVKHLSWLASHADPQARRVTIRQLLLHQAGIIRDGLDNDFLQLRQPFPGAADLEKIVLEARLVLESYDKLKYSNIGYALLGQVIQAVSGESYEAYITTHIIDPLELANTQVGPGKTMATGHTAPRFGMRYTSPRDLNTRALLPVLGICSTAADMCTFVTNKTLLSDTLRHMAMSDMHEHWSPAESRGSRYGYGFQLYRIGKHQVVGHGGHVIGYRTCTYFDPKANIAVSVLTNSRDAPIMQMCEGIFSVLDHFLETAAEPTPPEFEKYNIRVMNLWDVLEIVATKKRIVVADPDSWLPFAGADELVSVAPETFKIAKTHDLLSQDELVHAELRDGRVWAIKYAGSTMRPAHLYKNWLANNYPV